MGLKNSDSERRAYQRAYYRKHSVKAKAYQVAYNKLHKKRGAHKGANPWQHIKKQCFSLTDLTESPTIKFERQIELILSGQMGITF